MRTAVVQFGYNNATSCSSTEKKASLEDGEYGEAFGVFQHMSRNDLGVQGSISMWLNSSGIIGTHAIQAVVSSINERVDCKMN